MPPIVIVFLTFRRTDYAVRTIRGVLDHLRYQGDLLWYVADDGSGAEHLAAVHAALDGQRIIGEHSEHIGYGAGANRGWHVAHEHADLTLWLEDDWELRTEFDLTPFAKLLNEQPDVGMVRLGYLNLEMTGAVFGHAGHLYWRLDRQASPYVFTGHPSLRQRRFREAYGAYPEGLNPGQTELAYAWQFRQGKGPDIVWPAALSEWGVFHHIGAEKSY